MEKRLAIGNIFTHRNISFNYGLESPGVGESDDYIFNRNIGDIVTELCSSRAIGCGSKPKCQNILVSTNCICAINGATNYLCTFKSTTTRVLLWLNIPCSCSDFLFIYFFFHYM